MSEDSTIGTGGLSFDMPKNQSSEIKVIGVGGGGSNAVNHMFEQGIKGVDFVVCNTDAQALSDSPIPNKIQLGVTLTEGLGAGANPEVGEKSAMESLEEVKTLLSKNTKMVFITAGMGGGTGTGAAPIIAKTAREMGVLTVGIVTFPFSFEGVARKRQAEEGIESLRANVDSLIVVNNDKLRDVYGNLGFKSGFVKANEVLSTAAKGIAEVITQHYRMNIDLNDARAVLADSGTAIMGSAKASGEGRAIEAVSRALDSPLLNDNDILGCRSVLLLIISGEQEITLDEIGEVTDYVQREAGGNADVIMGIGEDETIGDSICVTVIATGFDPDQQENIMPGEPTKIVHRLDGEDLAPKVTMSVEPTKTVAPEPRNPRPTRQELLQKESKPIEKPQQEAPVKYNLFDDEPSGAAQGQAAENQVALHFEMPAVEERMPEMEAETENEGLVFHQLMDEEAPDQDLAKEEEVEEEVQFELKIEEEETVKESIPKDTWARPVSFPERQAKTEELTNQVPPQHVDEPVQESESGSFSVAEEQLKRARERKARLKSFNYKFHNAASQTGAENIPAYKRMGVELNKVSHSSDHNVSRYTLGEDEQNNPQFRSNNSFLHDNVD